jgi:hypothetical protein
MEIAATDASTGQPAVSILKRVKNIIIIVIPDRKPIGKRLACKSFCNNLRKRFIRQRPP